MNINPTRTLVATVALSVFAAGGVAIATTETDGGHHSTTRSTTTKEPWHTPNECIRINGGDFNACNVGNSGSGNGPYLPLG